MKVHVAIPPVADLYPCGHVCAGLRHLGHTLVGNDRPLDADALVVWSPWHRSRREALFLHYKRAERPVLVMENGWLSPLRKESYYQVAHDGWNGTGHFAAGGPERWRSWHLAPVEWTERTRENSVVLVIGQRGHPWDDRTSMPGWHRTVEIPGIDPVRVLRRDRDAPAPLADPLNIACEVHVWSSNAASWAVLCGKPVVHHGNNLMVKALTSRPGEPLYRGARTPEFERLAWAQWSAGEILAGEPFARLLDGYPAMGLK